MFTFVNLWDLSRKTLFDDIELPTGTYTATLPNGDLEDKTITPDKETLVNTILDEVAEYQPLSIDVDLMKFKINNFFKKNKEGFSRLIAINLITYSPIENTDRYESGTDNYSRNDKFNGSTNLTTSNKSTDENKISAFDSDSYQPNTQLTNTNSGTETTSNNTNNDVNDITKHNLRTHGNIGVTTNQQMMVQEVDFWNKFNFYDIVANKFLFEMCLTCETYN